MAQHAPVRPPPSELFSLGLRRSIGVIMIGASLSFLDATIVNVALRTLSVDLHAPLARCSEW